MRLESFGGGEMFFTTGAAYFSRHIFVAITRVFALPGDLESECDEPRDSAARALVCVVEGEVSETSCSTLRQTYLAGGRAGRGRAGATREKHRRFQTCK